MIVIWLMFALIGLIFIRLIKGPTVWDRLLAMNLVTSKVIVIIITFAYLNEITFLLDFAIVYSLMGFIGTIFISLFLSEQKLGRKRGKKDGSGNDTTSDK